MPSWLNNLGISFQSHFKYTGDLADVSKAISYMQKAVHLAPEGHAYLPSWLNNLGNSLQSCFEHTGNLADISDAITHQQRAVHLTLADISNAISCQQKAVHLTPEGHADMPIWLNNLGESFQSCFNCTGDLADFQMHLSIDHQCATYSSGSPSTRLMAAT